MILKDEDFLYIVQQIENLFQQNSIKDKDLIPIYKILLTEGASIIKNQTPVHLPYNVTITQLQYQKYFGMTKIPAIKDLRASYPKLDLRQAKEIIEHIQQQSK